jgi:hemolysin activation/secretion protein
MVDSSRLSAVLKSGVRGGLICWALGSPCALADPPHRLEIDEIRVEGNTVLPARDIETAVYDFLGPDRGPEDVEKARAALENLYQSRGYPTVTVEVPRQSAAGGVVRMTVTERKIGRLRVAGAHYYEPDRIRAAAPSLAPGTVPNIAAVQRDIVALNQWPGRTVVPELKPGRESNTMDVDLNVTDQPPWHGSLELNNRYSADTTPLRLVGSLSYDNLWQRGDSLKLFAEVDPQNTANALVYSISYTARIPDTDLSLVASYLKSDSNVAAVGGTDVVGKGQIAGLRLIVPLPGLERFTNDLSVGADYKDFGQQLTLSGQGNRIPLSYYPVSLAYDASLTWDDKSRTDLNAAVVLGTPGLGSSAAAFEENRAYASPAFAYFRGSLAQTQSLPHEAQFYVRVQGQATTDPLVPNEQFAVGGLDTVRGYLEAEALGDNAAGIQLELRSPPLDQKIVPHLNDLRVHIFVDAAETGLNQPLPEQTRSYGLSSIGFGVRTRIADHFSATVENAFTLSNGLTTKRGNDAVLFRVLGDF